MAQSASRSRTAPKDVSGSLEIETANMYASRLGNQGISPEDVKSIDAELKRAHRAVQAGMRGGLDAEFACLNLHALMPETLPAVDDMASELRHFSDVIVIGIGGSSLGAKAVYHALKGELPAGLPRLHFVENVDPYDLHDLLARLPALSTAAVCISKSGGTLETIAQFLVVREWLGHRLSHFEARRRQWVITDPERGWLRDLARKESLPSLPVPPRVGGRYSVLSAVGLLPLAAVGVDVRALLEGAADNAARCGDDSPGSNPALELAALYYLLDTQKQKRTAIMMPYVNRLSLFGDWYRQLWAESLGKVREKRDPAGSLPVTALGTVDQHSQLQMYLESRQDKMFSFLELADWEQNMPVPDDQVTSDFAYLKGRSLSEIMQAEFEATRTVVTQAGHPNLTIRLPRVDARTMGALIDLYQRTTVYAGLLYGVNPLDQPSVEKGKVIAIDKLKNV